MGSDNAILVLDDREDVTESTASLLEAHGLMPLVSNNVQSAWESLRSNPAVRAALIDKNLTRNSAEGLDFLIDASREFPEVKFFLITAWEILPREHGRIAEHGVQVLRKGYVSPRKLVELVKGTQPTILETSDSEGLVFASNTERVAELNEKLMEEQFEREVISVDVERLRSQLKPIAEELAEQIRLDGWRDSYTSALHQDELAANDLVEEILELTPFGGEMITAYVRSNRWILEAARGRGRLKRAFGRMVRYLTSAGT